MSSPISDFIIPNVSNEIRELLARYITSEGALSVGNTPDGILFFGSFISCTISEMTKISVLRRVTMPRWGTLRACVQADLANIT